MTIVTPSDPDGTKIRYFGGDSEDNEYGSTAGLTVALGFGLAIVISVMAFFMLFLLFLWPLFDEHDTYDARVAQAPSAATIGFLQAGVVVFSAILAFAHFVPWIFVAVCLVAYVVTGCCSANSPRDLRLLA